VGNVGQGNEHRGGQVQLWDGVTGKKRRAFTAHATLVDRVAFLAGGKKLVTMGYGMRKKPVIVDGSADFGQPEARLWDLATYKCRAVLPAGGNGLAVSTDGRTLASSGYDQAARCFTVVLLDVATRKQRVCQQAHKEMVYGFAFAKDGKVLATGSMDRTIKLWDVATATEQTTLGGHTNWVYAVAFAPDGNTLASVSEDKTLRLWVRGSTADTRKQ
jgi:WD40 repeat protein